MTAGKTAPRHTTIETHRVDAGSLKPAEATEGTIPTALSPRLKPAPAIGVSQPNHLPPEPTLAADQARCEAHIVPVGGDPSLGHLRSGAQKTTAEGNPYSGHSDADAQKPVAGVGPDPQAETISTTHPTFGSFLPLRVWSEMYTDAQQARIACDNRVARGGLDPATYAPQLEVLAIAEHSLKLAMVREYRRVCPPAIREWQKNSIGIGEHLLARLLGIIGHPCQSTRHHWEGTGSDRVLVDDGPLERRVSDLWSYCGHGDPGRRRARGSTAEEAAAGGNPRAKMLVHLLAEACMKQRESPYRAVYERRKAQTEGRLHAAPCPPCHAQAGDPWRDGHRHADALRITGKEILRDLWMGGRE